MVVFVSIVFGITIAIAVGLIVWLVADTIRLKAEFDSNPSDQVFIDTYRGIKNVK